MDVHALIASSPAVSEGPLPSPSETALRWGDLEFSTEALHGYSYYSATSAFGPAHGRRTPL